MRILGIDPGLQTTGFGVVDVDGHRLGYVGSGTIRTTALARGDLPGRLKVLFEGVTEVVKRYQPDQATVEIVFVNVNPQSTLLLGQARGAALAALVSQDLPVAEYTALQMKKPWSATAAPPRARCRRWCAGSFNSPACPAPTRPTPWVWRSRMPMRAWRWPG